MKTDAKSITLRAGIATVLSLSFIIYPAMRFSSATVLASPAVELKTAARFRSEAASYDAAIRAVAGIATMKLETGEDLKKAIAILNRERDNLKLGFSRLVADALSDSTYASAFKKKITDEQTATTFANELKADRNAILKLDGAGALATRLQRRLEADAATLRRAAKHLKEAAEKIKKASQARVDPGVKHPSEFKIIRVGLGTDRGSVEANGPVASTRHHHHLESIVEPPLIVPLLVVAAIMVAGTIQAVVGTAILVKVADDYLSDGGNSTAAQDECYQRADAGYSRCVSATRDLPSGFPLFIREAAEGLCYSQWLLDTGGCYLLN